MGIRVFHLRLGTLGFGEVDGWKGGTEPLIGLKRENSREDTTCNLGDSPPTVLLPLHWGWVCRFQKPAVAGSIRPTNL